VPPEMSVLNGILSGGYISKTKHLPQKLSFFYPFRHIQALIISLHKNAFPDVLNR